MLGADHHGYVNRLKAIAACAGDDMDRNIEVKIGQFVKMLRDGEEVRMSKRAGNIITIDDVVDWIGVDAARYTLSRSSTDSTITLDINVLTSQTNENPVFYVQYAHTRMCGVTRKAETMGITKGAAEDFKPELLATEWESALLGLLGEFPGSSPSPARRASRTTWPATWSSWPAPTTGSTTTARSCRRATRRSPTSPAPGSGSPTRPAR